MTAAGFTYTGLIASLPCAELLLAFTSYTRSIFHVAYLILGPLRSGPSLAAHSSSPSSLNAPLESEGGMTIPLASVSEQILIPAWKDLPHLCKLYTFLKVQLECRLFCEILIDLAKEKLTPSHCL